MPAPNLAGLPPEALLIWHLAEPPLGPLQVALLAPQLPDVPQQRVQSRLL